MSPGNPAAATTATATETAMSIDAERFPIFVG
jgi:hypothetical protein